MQDLESELFSLSTKGLSIAVDTKEHFKFIYFIADSLPRKNEITKIKFVIKYFTSRNDLNEV